MVIWLYDLQVITHRNVYSAPVLVTQCITPIGLVTICCLHHFARFYKLSHLVYQNVKSEATEAMMTSDLLIGIDSYL